MTEILESALKVGKKIIQGLEKIGKCKRRNQRRKKEFSITEKTCRDENFTTGK